MEKIPEKPLKRPEKRFQELPGGIRKREPERYGGPLAEQRKRKELKGQNHDLSPQFLKEKEKYSKRSSGFHSVERHADLEKPVPGMKKYQNEAEEYRKQRLEEDLTETNK